MQLCRAALLFSMVVIAVDLSSDPLIAAQVRAVAGQPFGVAEITFPVPAADARLPVGVAALTVDGPPGRVLYPAVVEGAINRL